MVRDNMDHLTWIKEQFEKKNTRAIYRNVLIHTSFLETVVIKEADQGRTNFECAIKILRSNAAIYNRNTIDMIDGLRKKRNKIIHELLKNNGLDEALINMTIKEMRGLLKNIYHNAPFVQRYFLNEYQIDTAQF